MGTEKRATFDQVAQLYDHVRPHYPEQLVRDVETLAHLKSSALILEIGAGTGIATLPFARLGYKITAVEMGSELACVARANLAAFANVQVITNTFEGFELPDCRFDLVMSATAFHWLDPNLRWTKSAAALCAGGYIAVFRYLHVAGGDRDFFQQYQHCFQKHLPGAESNFELPEIDDYRPAIAFELEECGLFGTPEVRTYIIEKTYTREHYLRLLSTYSDHLIHEKPVREKFLACVGALIDQKFNGRIRKCYLYELIVAQKR